MPQRSVFLPALLLSLCLIALSTSCIADEVAVARTITVQLDAALAASDLRDQVEAATLALAAERNEDVIITLEDVDATRTVNLSLDALKEARTQTPVRSWAAFTGFWSTEGDIELAALSSDQRTVYLPAEYKPSLIALLGETQATWLPLHEIAGRVAADAGSIGLFPSDRADPALRSLSVDGINPLHDPDSFNQGRLVERIGLDWQEAELDDFATALAQRLTVTPPSIIHVIATGDIIPARCVYARHAALNDFTHAFAAVAERLRAADLTLGSLDASISDAATPIGCRETFNLLAPSRSVEGLTSAGFDVVTVATNHIKDCGEAGGCGHLSFNDTLANLRNASIQPVGGGANLDEARRPVVVEIKGVRFAILGYDDIAAEFYGATATTPGSAPLNAASLREDIEAAQLVADVVIVMPHWGVEYQANPTSRQQELAQIAMEAGADLVIGNHPHWVQAVDWLDGSFVTYALGNFVFDQDWSLETQQGAVLEATFVGARLSEVRLIPIRIIDMHQATWASATESASILTRVENASKRLH